MNKKEYQHNNENVSFNQNIVNRKEIQHRSKEMILEKQIIASRYMPKTTVYTCTSKKLFTYYIESASIVQICMNCKLIEREVKRKKKK